MNRAQRRKAGIKEHRHRISLDEWRAEPDRLVTRADCMALMQLHEVNKHERKPWWRKLYWRKP